MIKYCKKRGNKELNLENLDNILEDKTQEKHFEIIKMLIKLIFYLKKIISKKILYYPKFIQ